MEAVHAAGETVAPAVNVVPLHPVLESDGPTDPEEGDAASAGPTAASRTPLAANAASRAFLMARLPLIFISPHPFPT